MNLALWKPLVNLVRTSWWCEEDTRLSGGGSKKNRDQVKTVKNKPFPEFCYKGKPKERGVP